MLASAETQRAVHNKTASKSRRAMEILLIINTNPLTSVNRSVAVNLSRVNWY